MHSKICTKLLSKHQSIQMVMCAKLTDNKKTLIYETKNFINSYWIFIF